MGISEKLAKEATSYSNGNLQKALEYLSKADRPLATPQSSSNSIGLRLESSIKRSSLGRLPMQGQIRQAISKTEQKEADVISSFVNLGRATIAQTDPFAFDAYDAENEGKPPSPNRLLDKPRSYLHVEESDVKKPFPKIPDKEKVSSRNWASLEDSDEDFDSNVSEHCQKPNANKKPESLYAVNIKQNEKANLISSEASKKSSERIAIANRRPGQFGGVHNSALKKNVIDNTKYVQSFEQVKHKEFDQIGPSNHWGANPYCTALARELPSHLDPTKNEDLRLNMNNLPPASNGFLSLIRDPPTLSVDQMVIARIRKLKWMRAIVIKSQPLDSSVLVRPNWNDISDGNEKRNTLINKMLSLYFTIWENRYGVWSHVYRGRANAIDPFDKALSNTIRDDQVDFLFEEVPIFIFNERSKRNQQARQKNEADDLQINKAELPLGFLEYEDSMGTAEKTREVADSYRHKRNSLKTLYEEALQELLRDNGHSRLVSFAVEYKNYGGSSQYVMNSLIYEIEKQRDCLIGADSLTENLFVTGASRYSVGEWVFARMPIGKGLQSWSIAQVKTVYGNGAQLRLRFFHARDKSVEYIISALIGLVYPINYDLRNVQESHRISQNPIAASHIIFTKKENAINYTSIKPIYQSPTPRPTLSLNPIVKKDRGPVERRFIPISASERYFDDVLEKPSRFPPPKQRWVLPPIHNCIKSGQYENNEMTDKTLGVPDINEFDDVDYDDQQEINAAMIDMNDIREMRRLKIREKKAQNHWQSQSTPDRKWSLGDFAEACTRDSNGLVRRSSVKVVSISSLGLRVRIKFEDESDKYKWVFPSDSFDEVTQQSGLETDMHRTHKSYEEKVWIEPYPKEADYKTEEMHEISTSLQKLGFVLTEENSDGNCLFRAFARQITGSPQHHRRMRQLCTEYLRLHPDDFTDFLEEPITSYLERMSQNGVWGGEHEIVALCKLFKVNCEIYKKKSELQKAYEGFGADSPVVRMSYHGGTHYNSVLSGAKVLQHFPIAASGENEGENLTPKSIYNSLEEALLAANSVLYRARYTQAAEPVMDSLGEGASSNCETIQSVFGQSRAEEDKFGGKVGQGTNKDSAHASLSSVVITDVKDSFEEMTQSSTATEFIAEKRPREWVSLYDDVELSHSTLDENRLEISSELKRLKDANTQESVDREWSLETEFSEDYDDIFSSDVINLM